MRTSHRMSHQPHRPDRSARRETVVVGLLLLVAVALRCVLASRGWPAVESDEATMGLMADDILWHGAHPTFFYGQHYLGAFQAYLAAPIFAALGPTTVALHVTTTLEILLFLLILYPLTRAIFSRSVAMWTLLLLALGPYEGLDLELHAGAGAQETLVFGVALLALTYLRLRYELGERAAVRDGGHEQRNTYPRTRLLPVLDVSLGAVAGLGLWAHLLTVPFIATAIIALGAFRISQALRPTVAERLAEPVAMGVRHLTLSSEETSARLAAFSPASPVATLSPPASAVGAPRLVARRIGEAVATGVRQAALFTLGFVLAAFPFILANLASHGATFSETLGIAGAGAASHPGLAGHALSLGEQALATLLIGLPRLLNATLLCPNCVMWPRPHAAVSVGAIAREALVALPLSLSVIALWWVSALALAPGRWLASLRALVARGPKSESQQSRSPEASLLGDPGWWGRAIFVVGAALVFLEYVASSASYTAPGTSARYLIGLYVFTPLVIAPLLHWSQPLWERWHRARSAVHGTETPIAGPGPRRLLGAWLCGALLVGMALLNLAGAIKTMDLAQNRAVYGVPAPAPDLQVINFLQDHHATRFYTTYWVCNRLMFVAEERLTCAVVSDQNAFQSGANRIDATKAALAVTPHPAYVFFSGDAHAAPTLPGQVRDAIASGDPRFSGYVSAMVAGYQIFYYAGAS